MGIYFEAHPAGFCANMGLEFASPARMEPNRLVSLDEGLTETDETRKDAQDGENVLGVSAGPGWFRLFHRD